MCVYVTGFVETISNNIVQSAVKSVWSTTKPRFGRFEFSIAVKVSILKKLSELPGKAPVLLLLRIWCGHALGCVLSTGSGLALIVWSLLREGAVDVNGGISIEV